MAKLMDICISKKRQQAKKGVNRAYFIEGGIEGDSHFKVTEREVSLLRIEDIQEAEEKAGFTFPPGSLAENLVVQGLPSEMLPGSRIKIGPEVELVVIERGKRPGEPHNYSYRGWCLLPDAGYFLKILVSGWASVEDKVYFFEK